MATDSLYRAPWLPSSDLGNATSESLFFGGGIGSPGPVILPLPSNGLLANRRFRVYLFGRVSSNANVNFTLALYFGFSKVVANNTQVASSGSCALNSIKSNFQMTTDLLWDGDSNSINGNVLAGQVCGLTIGTGAIASTISNINPNRDSSTFLQSGATYGFTATGLFSASAANHAFIDEFGIELA